MGLRFSGDKKSPAERFTRFRETLGDKFMGVEIDSSPAKSMGLQEVGPLGADRDYSDEATSPTRLALEGVMDFFTSRLGIAPKDTSSKD